MKHKKTTMALAVSIALLGMVSSGAAQVENDTETDITVTVDARTAIDVSPESLDFGSMVPGESKTDTVGDFSALEIENVGSTNLTNIQFNTSTPDSNPFGTGVGSNHDVGNFVQIAPQEDNMAGIPDTNAYKFVTRKEFNESNDLSYVFAEDGWDYGRFRVEGQELFWAVNTDTSVSSSGGCSTTGSDDFRVGVNAHNRTTTGSTDFTSGSSEYDSYSLSGVSDYALATDVTVDVPNHDARTYDVLVKCDGSQTYTARTKYSVNPLGVDISGDASAANYVLDSGEEDMFPGEHFTTNVSISVPRGVASSSSALTGTLQVLAEQAN
jgi:hypothetical protein